MKIPPSATRRQRGVALLEVMIATIILGIGLLGTVGLQARSYAALADAGQRAEATIAAEKLMGIMSNDSAALALYALAAGGTPTSALQPWVTETQKQIPGATLTVTVQPEASRTRVVILIRWTRKADSKENRHELISYVAS